MARTEAVLGDARRDERAEWLFDRIVATGSLKLREIGGTRSGEMAAHRLLSCGDVEPTRLLMPHIERTVGACKGRRVVAAQSLPPRRWGTQARSISIARGAWLPGSARPAIPASGAFSFIP
jgi:hypothetical protein